MRTASVNSPQPWPGAIQARSAGRTGRAWRVKPRQTLTADQSAFKAPAPVHGRAYARPSRSAAGAGNEGTGHALPPGLRRFSDVAVQI